MSLASDHHIVSVEPTAVTDKITLKVPRFARRVGENRFVVSLLGARCLCAGSRVDNKPIKWIAVSTDYCLAVLSTAEKPPHRDDNHISSPILQLGDEVWGVGVPKNPSPLRYRVGGSYNCTLRGNVTLCDSLVDEACYTGGTFLQHGGSWGILLQPAPQVWRHWTEPHKCPRAWLAKFYSEDHVAHGAWKSIRDWHHAHDALRLCGLLAYFTAAWNHASDSEFVTVQVLQDYKKAALPPDVLSLFYEHLIGTAVYMDTHACGAVAFDDTDTRLRRDEISEFIDSFADLTNLPGLVMPTHNRLIESSVARAAGLLAKDQPTDVVLQALAPALERQPKHPHAAVIRWAAAQRAASFADAAEIEALQASNDTFETTLLAAHDLYRLRRWDSALGVMERMIDLSGGPTRLIVACISTICQPYQDNRPSPLRIERFLNKAIALLSDDMESNLRVGYDLRSIGQSRFALVPLLNVARTCNTPDLIDKARALARELGDQQALDQLDKIK